MPSEVAVALFRIVQEAINNVIQHAAATQVTLTLLSGDGRLCLFVEDDGQGFDPAATARGAVARQQLGLLGMGERAELVGATFAVDSSPGEGTCIQVCWQHEAERECRIRQSSRVAARPGQLGGRGEGG